MLTQHLIVGCIVALCAVAASWSLMPALARRACARAALRLPWPAPIAVRWQRAAEAKSGCDGCRHAGASYGASRGATHGASAPPRPATIHVVRRAAHKRD
jgi:hypothetical protein